MILYGLSLQAACLTAIADKTCIRTLPNVLAVSLTQIRSGTAKSTAYLTVSLRINLNLIELSIAENALFYKGLWALLSFYGGIV